MFVIGGILLREYFHPHQGDLMSWQRIAVLRDPTSCGMSADCPSVIVDPVTRKVAVVGLLLPATALAGVAGILPGEAAVEASFDLFIQAMPELRKLLQA